MPYIRPFVHLNTSCDVIWNSGYTQEEDEQEELPENGTITAEDNEIEEASKQASVCLLASNNEKKSKKRRASVDPFDETQMNSIKKKQENLERSNPDEDARKMFLLSLLPDVNQLSDAAFRHFKIKSMMLVDELLSSGSLNDPLDLDKFH